METKIEIWKISELLDSLDTIVEQPKYQRGAVWSSLKRQMLIDSMLRGVDIPKLYLRVINRGQQKYEVADGQQRIIAIREFKNKELRLSNKTINGLDLSKIGNFVTGDKNIEEINEKLSKAFMNYELTIAIVQESTNTEIRTLFARLQMGDPLNPAEKRNAIISNLGTEIDNISLNHDFFKTCKIRPERYKHQDYVTHAIALVYYKNKFDLKALILNKIYFELAGSVPQSLISSVVKVLDWMHEIDKTSKKHIINKWSFIDIFYLLYELRGKISSINFIEFGKTFKVFEDDRIKYSNKAEELITNNPSKYRKSLYNYIVAFKANGGNPKNIIKRFETFEYVFANSITLK
jgi:hypothetical protein